MLIATRLLLYLVFMATSVPALTSAAKANWAAAAAFGMIAAIALGSEVVVARIFDPDSDEE